MTIKRIKAKFVKVGMIIKVDTVQDKVERVEIIPRPNMLLDLVIISLDGGSAFSVTENEKLTIVLDGSST